MGSCLHMFLRLPEIQRSSCPIRLRICPAVHLSFRDVCLDNTTDPQFLEVTIKASKTNPFRQGVQVYVGRTNIDLCPVVAVLSCMVYRGTDTGPFFWYARIRTLTKERFVRDVRSVLQAAGIDSERLGKQFPYRGRINSSLVQVTGLVNQNPRSLAEHGLLTLHSYTQGDAMHCLMPADGLSNQEASVGDHKLGSIN